LIPYQFTMIDFEPTHIFTVPGAYRIMLTVMNDKGSIDTTSQPISLTNEALIFIPNVFTPNGDGTNKVFDPFCTRYYPGNKRHNLEQVGCPNL
jgi:PKD repeat protein